MKISPKIVDTEEKRYQLKTGKTQVCRIAIYNCLTCSKLCRTEVRKMKYASFTGKCKVCVNSRKPFESLFTSFLWQASKRNITVHITYEQFLNFTNTQKCFYCDEKIPWKPFGGYKTGRRGYFLDRKDNNQPYSEENCVVCCKMCNFTKANRYSFEEFCLLSSTLKQIKLKRKLL